MHILSLAHSPYHISACLEMHSKRPKRLDLNAPLLSARRSTTTRIEISRIDSFGGSCNRVPFSWEQSPGKPKDIVKRDNVEDIALPLPKPPPIRWQEEPTLTYEDGYGIHDELDNDNEYGHANDSHDNDDDDDDGFSDDIDLFSLAESLYTWEDLDLGDDIRGHDYGPSSPNFMMQRFLPAATALAASSLSALTIGDDLSNNKKRIVMAGYSSTSTNYCEDQSSCVPRVGGQAYSSSKGCGLEIFFPWRPKHKLCGVKSPVRRVRAMLKPQFGSMNE